MARPPKKPPEEWRREIMNAAKALFFTNGYEETSVAGIMKLAGGAKGLFYSFFSSKAELLQALSEQLFLERNPFQAVRERKDLSALEKIQELMRLNREDRDRDRLSREAVPILRDPVILTAAVEANRRILTPLWRELLEEGRQDGSIQTEYTRELSELLPLLNFWLLPSVFPATAGELRRKYRFAGEILTGLGLPILEGEAAAFAGEVIGDIASEEGEVQP
ncbi:MAG: TetR/AcrR family transcriptional regulator [Angelakisella sp.]|nr:TetR/AcrR family transcriptional regulator [Angelakisella sp.]